ncbi:MAG: hypothetical protein KGI28_08440 [Thaumarchaeota archaeon]|nr:hypothetical protein [Nitrososphaerota archaeon]
MQPERNHNGNKKENFTLRIDSEIMDVIKAKSDSENVSVNQFVNKLIGLSIYWNTHAPSAGWVPMPKQLLVELIDKMSIDEITTLAHNLGKTIAHDILLFTNNKYDVNSWINFLKFRSAVSGFSFFSQLDGNTISCTIHHGLGRKWTIWFKSFYEIVLLDMGANVTFDVSDNTLIMKIVC